MIDTPHRPCWPRPAACQDVAGVAPHPSAPSTHTCLAVYCGITKWLLLGLLGGADLEVRAPPPSPAQQSTIAGRGGMAMAICRRHMGSALGTSFRGI